MTEPETDPFLTLDLDGGPTPFFDINELKAWVDSERQAFGWLSEVYRAENAAGQGWSQINNLHNKFDSFIREFIGQPTNSGHRLSLITDLKLYVDKYIQVQKVASSESPDAQFVFGLREIHSDKAAGYALNLLMGQAFTPNSTNAWEGAFLALQYKKGSPETVDAERKALHMLKKGWASSFGKQHKAITERGGELNAEIAEHKETFESLKNKLHSFHGAEEEKFQKLYIKTEEELSDIKRTYKDKMALLAPVEYWTKKRSHHGSVMIWIGIATLVIGCATMAFFIDRSDTLMNETLTHAPLGQISILLAISTAGIWLTRLGTKIFVSNLHLRTDADERITMIQTYLALLSEGNGPKEGDRELILPALFKSTSTGFIKEDGPAGFFEILKLIKRE